MDRQPPRATNNEIDLYIRTYYSLLRSSAEVSVRAFEEPHIYSRSSLHAGARDAAPDLAAFAYSAARLPECMPSIRLLVLGQSKDQFEAAGYAVRNWQRIGTRGRRRAMLWNGNDVLACFVTSTSDIDDLVPMVTCYQIEWKKLHATLRDGDPLSDNDAAILRGAFGPGYERGEAQLARGEIDLSMRLLSGSYVEYQRTAQRWWGEIENGYLSLGGAVGNGKDHRRRPVYVVSSNTHSLVNLLGGYAKQHRDQIIESSRANNPEGVAELLEQSLAQGDEHEAANCGYYLLHKFLNHHSGDARVADVQAFDRESGITTIRSPGRIDVNAQLIDLSRLHPDRFDPRLGMPGLETLAGSDAVILNIDYPLGMAGYHHLSRLGQGVGEIRGIYVMGKAATLNGRVGDVMVSSAAYDEHSSNTYLFRNCFTAADVKRFVRRSSVLDGQKALTARGSFLQNRDYMSVFYQEGYTVLEMETGPFLSAIYELCNPKRHPKDEIVHLSNLTPFDVGFLHYASDTPYSRRQSLLSKSLSYFGVESTYACATAIARRILRREVARLSGESL